MSSTTSNPEIPLIPFTSINKEGNATIVLIHGLLSSPKEWSHVSPYLTQPQSNDPKSYHIITPYLPSHGQASSIKPFTLPYATELMAHLIRTEAHNGRAHVVGLSAGGYVALHLAKTHPELISTLFVTGIGNLLNRDWLVNIAPYILYPEVSILYYLPERIYKWVQSMMQMDVPEGLREEMWANVDVKMVRDAYQSFGKDGGPTTLEMRTLVVAGGKQDSLDGTKAYDLEVRKGNAQSKAVVIRNAAHAWNVQFPELFARGIRAWIAGEDLPSEFDDLE